METTETFGPPNDLKLTFEAQAYLREAGRWAYFLGILGFIITGFILLGAVFVGSLFSLVARLQPSSMATMPAGFGGLLSFIYILVAVFYFFFSYYLFQFGNNIKKGIIFSDQGHVTNALGKLKSFFKMWGITTIVIISLYALFMIGIIVAGIGAASMMQH